MHAATLEGFGEGGRERDVAIDDVDRRRRLLHFARQGGQRIGEPETIRDSCTSPVDRSFLHLDEIGARMRLRHRGRHLSQRRELIVADKGAPCREQVRGTSLAAELSSFTLTYWAMAAFDRIEFDAQASAFHGAAVSFRSPS
jgi:hypothetical protein